MNSQIIFLQRLPVVLAVVVLLGACAPERTVNPEIWKTFMTTMKEPRLYAMRRDEGELPLLIEALKDSRSTVRLNAAQDLKTMGRRAERAVPALIGCFDDSHPKVARVSYLAVRAIGVSSGQAVEVVALLEEVLDSPRPAARRYALDILGEIGVDARGAIPRIAKLLDDRDGTVQLSAAWVLTELNAQVEREKVVRVLAQSLGSGDKTAEYRSSAMLVRLGENRIVDDFRQKQMLQAKSQAKPKKVETQGVAGKRPREKKSSRRQLTGGDVLAFRAAASVRRLHAREYIERKNPGLVEQWKWQVPFLTRMVTEGNTKERWVTVQTLRTMAHYIEEAIPPLIEALGDPQAKIRRSAASALGELREERAIQAIARLLDDPEVRTTAVAALERIGTTGAYAALKSMSDTSEETEKEEEEDKVLSRHKIDVGEAPPLSAGEAHGLCRMILKESGASGSELSELADECVRETGARY